MNTMHLYVPCTYEYPVPINTLYVVTPLPLSKPDRFSYREVEVPADTDAFRMCDRLMNTTIAAHASRTGKVRRRPLPTDRYMS